MQSAWRASPSLPLFPSDAATAISPRLLAHSERMEEKGKEGATEEACISQAQGRRALRLYELNCPASRESFIMSEALRKLLPVSK